MLSLVLRKGGYVGGYLGEFFVVLKGDTKGYVGDYLGDVFGVLKGDTRSLDYSSYPQYIPYYSSFHFLFHYPYIKPF